MRKTLSIIVTVIFAIFAFSLVIEIWGEFKFLMYPFLFLVLFTSWWIYVKLEHPWDSAETLRIIYFGFIITGAPVIGGVIAVGYNLNPTPFILGGYVLGIVISFRLDNWLTNKK